MASSVYTKGLPLFAVGAAFHFSMTSLENQTLRLPLFIKALWVSGEIKRRTRVAVLFPNADSALRLVTGVIIEIHEEWVTGKQYLDMDPLLIRRGVNEE